MLQTSLKATPTTTACFRAAMIRSFTSLGACASPCCWVEMARARGDKQIDEVVLAARRDAGRAKRTTVAKFRRCCEEAFSQASQPARSTSEQRLLAATLCQHLQSSPGCDNDMQVCVFQIQPWCAAPRGRAKSIYKPTNGYLDLRSCEPSLPRHCRKLFRHILAKPLHMHDYCRGRSVL